MAALQQLPPVADKICWPGAQGITPWSVPRRVVPPLGLRNSESAQFRPHLRSDQLGLLFDERLTVFTIAIRIFKVPLNRPTKTDLPYCDEHVIVRFFVRILLVLSPRWNDRPARKPKMLRGKAALEGKGAHLAK
jgi:hypothetical protein